MSQVTSSRFGSFGPRSIFAGPAHGAENMVAAQTSVTQKKNTDRSPGFNDVLFSSFFLAFRRVYYSYTL